MTKKGVIASPSVEGRGNPGGGVFLGIASSLALLAMTEEAGAPRNDDGKVIWLTKNLD